MHFDFTSNLISWCYLFQREPHPFLYFFSCLSKHVVSDKHKTLHPVCSQSSHHLHFYTTCGSLEKLTYSDLWTSLTRQHCFSLDLILDLAVYSNIIILSLSLPISLSAPFPTHISLIQTHTHTHTHTHNVLSLLRVMKTHFWSPQKAVGKHLYEQRKEEESLVRVLCLADFSQVSQCLHRCSLDTATLSRGLVDRAPCG